MQLNLHLLRQTNHVHLTFFFWADILLLYINNIKVLVTCSTYQTLGPNWCIVCNCKAKLGHCANIQRRNGPRVRAVSKINIWSTNNIIITMPIKYMKLNKTLYTQHSAVLSQHQKYTDQNPKILKISAK